MPDIRITKLTHACVRVSIGGIVLLIDPSTWSEPVEFVGADACLITHEHADHVDPNRLAPLGIPVFVPEGAQIDGLEVTRVAARSTFSAAGIPVRAVGERHAFVYKDRPSCANFGYLIDERVYHPGDAHALPEAPVETLLVPMAGPWFKVGDAIEFVRAVSPERSIGIHDAMLRLRGLNSVNRWLDSETDAGYRYLAVGDDI